MRFIPLLLSLSFVVAGDAPAIGLMLAGSATDQGWNQLAKEGLDAVAKRSGARVAMLQKVAQDKAGDELRAFAADGCALVIAHGYEFLTPAAEAAKGSTCKYAVSGADVAKPGNAPLDFDLSQASYQVGLIAGRLTTTGKLGYLGGAPFPSVQACLRGFIAGAKAANPKVEVISAYTSWDDREKNKAQAEAFIGQGVDMLYPNVDAAATGVLEAVVAANTKRTTGLVLAFGCVGDRNGGAAGTFVPASAVIAFEAAFQRLADETAKGTFQEGVRREGLATGTCVLRWNPAFAIAPAIKAEVDAAAAKLIDGTIAVPAQ